MKKVIIAICSIYLIVFLSLFLVRKTDLEKPIIEINGNQVSFLEEKSKKRTLIPYLLVTNYKVSNNELNITNKVTDNNIILNTNISDNASLIIKKDEEIHYQGRITDDLSSLLEEGLYDVSISDSYDGNFFSVVNLKYSFILDVEKDNKVTISNDKVEQGKIIFVTVDNIDDDTNVRIESEFEEVYQYKDNNKALFIIPLDLNYKTGDYEIKVYKEDEVINTDKIEVIAKNITSTKQSYTIDGSLTDIESLSKVITDSIKVSDEKRNWTNYFNWPLMGLIIREYHDEIIVDDRVYNHNAIDIRGEANSLVKSVSSGKVVFAGKTPLLNHVVIIDHGYNLFTIYGNLDVIDVNINELVKEDEVIGNLSETGDSYLHFQIILGKTSINPWTFLKK